MRIMIIQSEIEEAIGEKVLRQMSINDDMELKINLSATRGEEGMTATIDVVAKAVDEPVKMPARRKAATTTTAAPATTTSTGKAQGGQAAAAVQEDADEANDEKVVEAAEPQEEQEETPAAPTGSIFGNLRKPVNAAPAAAAAE